MISEEERQFATEAVMQAEFMLGRVMDVACDGAPTPKAERMAQLMVTAGLLTKLGMSRTCIGGNFDLSLDSVLEQMEFQWAAMNGDPDAGVDISEIVYPDGPGDYINQSN